MNYIEAFNVNILKIISAASPGPPRRPSTTSSTRYMLLFYVADSGVAVEELEPGCSYRDGRLDTPGLNKRTDSSVYAGIDF